MYDTYWTGMHLTTDDWARSTMRRFPARKLRVSTLIGLAAWLCCMAALVIYWTSTSTRTQTWKIETPDQQQQFYIRKIIVGIEPPGEAPVVTNFSRAVLHTKEDDRESVVVYISCFTYEDLRLSTTLVKSILMYTRRRISLRFLTNAQVKHSVHTLYTTWDLDRVTIPHYIEIQMNNIRPTELVEKINHYIGVEKYFLLVPGLLFGTDIGDIWEASEESVIVPVPFRPNQTTSERPESGVFHQQDVNSPMFPADLLRTMHALSGDIFRKNATMVDEPTIKKKIEEDDCYNFRYEATLQRRTHPCFYCYTGVTNTTTTITKRERTVKRRRRYIHKEEPKVVTPSPTEDVTLATQLNMDRVLSLARVLKSWDGPASIVFYVTDSGAGDLLRIIKRGLLPNNRQNVRYHVVYARGQYYPINVLRNFAIREVTTSHIFILDADFVPMESLYKRLLTRLPLGTKQALIVPAFQTIVDGYVIPKFKKELVNDVSAYKVSQFHQREFEPGQGPWNYTKWRRAKEPYEVQHQLDFEPFLVLNLHKEMPLFEEQLIERMKNKIEHVYVLYKTGYNFTVLPDGFTLHLPHPKTWVGMIGIRFRNCIQKLVYEIHKRYEEPEHNVTIPEDSDYLQG